MKNHVAGGIRARSHFRSRFNENQLFIAEPSVNDLSSPKSDITSYLNFMRARKRTKLDEKHARFLGRVYDTNASSEGY